MTGHIVIISLAVVALAYARDTGDLVDFEALTHFTTDFEVNLRNAFEDFSAGGTPALNLEVPASLDMLVKGTLLVDIPAKTFRITAHTKAEVPSWTSAPTTMHAATEITFNGDKGYASWRSDVGATPSSGPYTFDSCLRVEFPRGLMLPSDTIKQQLEAQKPMVEKAMQNLPRFSLHVGGRGLNVFPVGRGVFFALYDDDDELVSGTPYGVMDFGSGFDELTKQQKNSLTAKVESGELKPALVFSNWEKASNVEITEAQCILKKPSEQNPHVTLALAAAERVLAGLQSMQPMSSASFAPLGVQPSSILTVGQQTPSVANSCPEALASSASMSTWPFATVVTLVTAAALGLIFSLIMWKRSQAPHMDDVREYFQVA